MKEVLKYIIFAIGSFLIIACSKEDKNTETKPVVQGNFTINNISFDLHDGTIAYFGSEGYEGDTAYYFYFYLYSNGIYYKENYGFTGEGSLVKFCISNSSLDGLSQTTYPLSYNVKTQLNEAFDLLLFPVYKSEAYTAITGNVNITNINDSTLKINIEGMAFKSSDDTQADEVPYTVDFTGVFEQ